MDVMSCQDLAVPMAVMQHVVNVESSFNPYAIGVVGGHLRRQPKNLPEALSTARMLESRGYNFSLGLAQVNRYNLARYGLTSYEQAFQACPNLRAGARILADCHVRSGNDWGKSLSCYYSGDFVTGFRQGYVQKVFASARHALHATYDGFPATIAVADYKPAWRHTADPTAASTLARRIGDVRTPIVQLASLVPEASLQSPLIEPARTVAVGAIAVAASPAPAAASQDVVTTPAPIDQAFVF